jgi:HNH endonuclease
MPDLDSTKPCECGCGTPVKSRFARGHNKRLLGGTWYTKIQHRSEHLIIAERAIGHKLPKGAEVHHVNEDKRDNRPENLVICPSREYHALLHQRAAVVRAGGDPNTQKLCSRCRQLKLLTEFSRNNQRKSHKRAAYCRSCTAEYKRTCAVDREKRRARAKRYYHRHIEQMRAKVRATYYRRKEKQSAEATVES